MTLAQLKKRVTYWQKKLGIPHIRVDVKLADPRYENDAYATCSPSLHYDQTTITFRTHLIEGTSDVDSRDLDEVIVHELLHFMFRDFDAAARSTESQLAPQAQELLDDRLRHEEERLVDKLACEIVRLVKA